MSQSLYIEPRVRGPLFHQEQSRRRVFRARRQAANRHSAIQAAAMGPGNWTGIQSNRNEDAANKEYLTALPTVLQRSQDLDVNNPDLRGFHRTRVAQIIGAGVKFRFGSRAKAIAKSLGISQAEMKEIAEEINVLRDLHSESGGFDSVGYGRWEGEQQERAILTAFIHGSCLIHRVWEPDNEFLPLSLELIPGVRISTPFDRMGDPRVSYGIEYTDEHRTKVVAFHVRRVSKTVGDSFVPDFEWDRLPIEDCSLLMLVEPAGMDRSMPQAIATMNTLRNRGEFMESTVSSARAQAKIYAVTECAPGDDPYARAADDADDYAYGPNGVMAGFQQMGDVQMMYTAAGEKVTWNSAKLPDPNLKDFADVTDARLARGLVCSQSRFKREVNSSWAGGRLEDQQDKPIVSQYRRSFLSAWQKVNGWFIEAVWLTGAIDLPGYSDATRFLWSQFRAQFYAEVHINPTDTQAAREKGYLMKTNSPQRTCEEDGVELGDILNEWADAYDLQDEIERERGFKPGRLAICVSGKAISTTSGEDIAPPPPVDAEDPTADPEAQGLKIAYGARRP